MTNYVLHDTLIFKKVQNFAKKFVDTICELAKKITLFFLFEVLYNWVKFRRLKMGDPVYFENIFSILENLNIRLFIFQHSLIAQLC